MPALAPLLALHAPDRLFSMPVNLVFALVVAGVLAVAFRRVATAGDHRAVPMMGIAAAFVFAGQMLNFPISAGTTGHLLGGTLAAILLGPWAGTIVMAAVIVVQAVVFQDGGITVLGPNLFNMGIIGTLIAYYVYRAVVGPADQVPSRVVGGAFFAAWFAVVLAAVFVSLQLAVSGTVPLDRVLPPMVLTHMAIGVGEGLITASIVGFLLRTRPDLMYAGRRSSRPLGRPVVVAGLAVSLACGAGLSLLPTLWDHPDGLESVGASLGFLSGEGEPLPAVTESGDSPAERSASGSDAASLGLMPEYTVAGLDGLAGTSLAGGIGTILMFGLSFVVGRTMIRRPGRSASGRTA